MKFTKLFLFGITILGISFSAARANENHLVLGSSEAVEELILFPRQVEEGPDGKIYVLDSGDSYIKVFNTNGKFLRKFGGEGEGPGEFQRTDGATFGFTKTGELFFTEFINGHRWITIFNLNGNLKKVISPQVDEMFGVQKSASLGKDRFLVQFAYNSVPRPVKNHFLYDSPSSIALMNDSGEIEREILKVNFTKLISYSSNGATTTLPFTPRLSWTTNGENEIIWSDGMSPVLKVVNINGDHIRDITTPLPSPGKVSRDDLQKWKTQREDFMLERNPVWYNRYGKVIEEYSNPPYDKPVIGSIRLTPRGNLLILGSVGPDQEDFVYWLLDSDGQRITSVDVDAWGVHFSENFLFWLTEDEEEFPQIHIMRCTGDEKVALEKMVETFGEEGGVEH